VDALAAVRRLSSAALEASDAPSIYSALAGELLSVFGVEQVHVARVAQDHSVARARLYRPGPGGAPEMVLEYLHHFDERSVTRLVMETGKPFVEPDVLNSDIANPALAERFHARSALVAPVAYGGDVQAVVALVSEVPREFSDEEVDLVYTLAKQASAALAVLEMSTHLGARAEQQTALARAARTLNARLDLNAVLTTLAHEANLALGGDVVGVYLGDAEQGGVAVAADGFQERSGWHGSVMRPGEGVAGQVLVTGRPVVTNAYKEEVRKPRSPSLDRVETAVGVPVSWDGELKGALSVSFHSMRRISDEDMGTLQAMADLAAVACSNAEAFEQVQEQARTDSLTGLLNHGAVHVRLTEEIARARRGAELCCVLLDLDDFKPVNDGHGHLVGDQILRLVASAIASEFRSYDGLGRFGGDEFVLVLPDTDVERAMAACRRLQAAVASAAQGVAHLGIELTTSIGLAHWEEPLTASELLDRADRALLVAKRRGKNLVVRATPESEQELARLESPAAEPTRVVNDLWGMVSTCERPHEVLERLPGFLCRALKLEEVAFYAPHPGGAGMVREAVGRAPGDPGESAFPSHPLMVAEERVRALRNSAISRATLGELLAALGAFSEAGGPEPTGSYAALPVARDGETHGLLLMRSVLPRFPLATLRLAEVLAAQAVTAMLGQSGGASRSAVGALAAAIDARDNYTHAHSQQVVNLAVETAQVLGLPETDIDRVRDGALLHDVGKVAIPNEILYKPGPLTEEEWAIMREHPEIGERILRRTPELAPIAPLVRHEHERWDGRGYPDGLAGVEIPMGSRVIFACDAYNAMITARPYRAPMSPEEAVAELRRGAGSQFDRQVLDALLRVLASQAVEPARA